MNDYFAMYEFVKLYVYHMENLLSYTNLPDVDKFLSLYSILKIIY